MSSVVSEEQTHGLTPLGFNGLTAEGDVCTGFDTEPSVVLDLQWQRLNQPTHRPSIWTRLTIRNLGMALYFPAVICLPGGLQGASADEYKSRIHDAVTCV